MNSGLLIIGTLVLVVSIFGYMYSENQQGLLEEGEDAIVGDQQNWGLIQSLSAAGIVGGIILILAGAIPEDWYSGNGMS